MKTETKKNLLAATLIVGVFLLFYFVNLNVPLVKNAFGNAMAFLTEYARLHVLTCLIPAFFIAGGITQLISSASVIKVLSGKAGKTWAYLAASVSGAILAVCSCTVIPLFMGIYNLGAGIGPATSFLYSGPAINILSMVLTAKAMGLQMGLARIIGSIVISIAIGLCMEGMFGREDKKRLDKIAPMQGTKLPGGKSALILTSLVLVLLSLTWQKGASEAIFAYRFWIAGFFLLLTATLSALWLTKEDFKSWMGATWDMAKKVLPLLFIGVIITGFVFTIIPNDIIQKLVGGNSLFANFFASVVGAFMYFATITEVPIVQGLMTAGMGKGPALALLLAGPALSLPSMILIWSILGPKKSMAYFSLVVIFSTIAGVIFGMI